MRMVGCSERYVPRSKKGPLLMLLHSISPAAAFFTMYSRTSSLSLICGSLSFLALASRLLLNSDGTTLLTPASIAASMTIASPSGLGLGTELRVFGSLVPGRAVLSFSQNLKGLYLTTTSWPLKAETSSLLLDRSTWIAFTPSGTAFFEPFRWMAVTLKPPF